MISGMVIRKCSSEFVMSSKGNLLTTVVYTKLERGRSYRRLRTVNSQDSFLQNYSGNIFAAPTTTLNAIFNFENDIEL